MKLGDGFYNSSHGHPSFVVSHPDSATGEVVVVNITTWTKDGDHACILEAGEHPTLQRTSIIPYAFAQILNPSQQLAWEKKYSTCDPLGDELLQRIQESFEDSQDAPQDCIKLVRASARLQRDEKRKADALALSNSPKVDETGVESEKS